MATVRRVADRWTAKSKQSSPSTKTSKPAQPTFGTSSQFKGIGRGVPGDPRK